MKKVISIILVAVLAVAMVTLVACGDKNGKVTDSNLTDDSLVTLQRGKKNPLQQRQ